MWLSIKKKKQGTQSKYGQKTRTGNSFSKKDRSPTGHEATLNISTYQKNANEKYSEKSPHTSENCHPQKPTVNVGEGVEKREPSYSIGRKVNWYSHYAEWYGGSLRN